MKEFKLIVGDTEKTYHLPTSIKEIPVSYYENVVKQVIPADNYSVIAIVYHESLASIILAQKQNRKTANIGVVPIFVKTSSNDSEFMNKIKLGDKLVIASSDLTLGHHVASPINELSLDKFITDVNADTFVAQRYKNNYGNEECYFVEFKLVPNCSIHGAYSSEIQATMNGDCNYIELQKVPQEEKGV